MNGAPEGRDAAPQPSAASPGQAPTIGIIMLDTVFPRIPGDIGNPATFSFPVLYRTVANACPQRVVQQADPHLLEPFIEAARGLENQGVRAIATSCGFLAIFQNQLAHAVNIPVFTSSLLQVPLARMALNRGQQIAILTARARSLTEKHLRGAGIQDFPLIILGMDDAPEFTRVFIDGNPALNVHKVRQEMIQAAQKLAQVRPKIGALILECTNMPPYAKSIQDILNIPVFDVLTLIQQVHASIEKADFR